MYIYTYVHILKFKINTHQNNQRLSRNEKETSKRR